MNLFIVFRKIILLNDIAHLGDVIWVGGISSVFDDLDGLFVTGISHHTFVAEGIPVHGVAQIGGVIRDALGKGAVGTEGGGDGDPFLVYVFLRGFIEGLSVPGGFPGVAGKGCLHAKQVVGFHCQGSGAVAAFQNGLSHGDRSQNSRLFHILPGQFADGLNEYALAHGVGVQRTVAVEIILFSADGLPFTLVAGTFDALLSGGAEIIFFLIDGVPSGDHFSFGSVLALGDKIEVFASDFFPAGGQSAVRIKIVGILIQYLPSGEHLSVGLFLGGSGEVVGLSFDGLPSGTNASAFTLGTALGTVVTVFSHGDPAGAHVAVLVEIVPVFSDFIKAGF